MGDIITIGIAGGTGSGKTTITRTLQDRFSSHVRRDLSRQLLPCPRRHDL